MTVPTLMMLMIGIAIIIVGGLARLFSTVRDTQKVGLIITLAGAGWVISVLVAHCLMANNVL